MKPRFVAIMVAAALFVSVGGFNSPNAAAVVQPASPVAAASSSESAVEEGLTDEGFDVEDVSVGAEKIEIDAAASDDDFAFDLAIDTATAEGTYTVRDVIKDQPVETKFKIDIETMTPQRIVFTLVDADTGESYNYDSAKPAESVAFVIPVAFAAVSVATALHYVAIGAAIVISGVLALEAAKAVSKIIAENKRRSDKRDYYTAVRSGTKVFILPAGLTTAQALSLGRAGGDVWAISQTKAKQLAKNLNPSGVPVGKEKHVPKGKEKYASDYLWHYHPYRHVPNMHSFFGPL